MNTETLKEILMEKSVSFTREELKKIIDEELEKSEEEMDVELIDQCLDLLDSSADSNSKTKKKRGMKANKILLIAAIVVLLLCIAVPVGAKFLNIDTAESVVKYCNDYFKIDMSEENLNDAQNIKSQVQQMGIEKIILPTGLFKNGCVADNFNIGKTDEISKEISFDISGADISCFVAINHYSNFNEYENVVGQFIVPEEAESFKQLNVDSLDLLIYNTGNVSTIYYYSDNCEYRLSLDNCDFNTAVSLAKTIAYI